MTKNKIISVRLLLSLILLAGISVSGGVYAITASTSGSADVRVEVREEAKDRRAAAIGESLTERAFGEIDRRIKTLTNLSARVQEMKRISASDKASLSSDITLQISNLTILRTKIESSTSTATLKEYAKSITGSYRIFALIIPRGHIIAAADRINFIADSMTSLSTKLELRINEAETAGNSVTSLQTSLSDMKAKIVDAKVDSAAAVALVAPLTPDNGDQAKFEANKKALKDAMLKIKAGTEDLKLAREDLRAIIKGLKEFNIKVKVNATSTASSSRDR